MVKKIVKPLKKLTEAATKLSNEDYDVEIESSDTHEIKLLSTAFENMTKHLKEHEKLQQRLAYCDSLTGLKNTTAYKEWISDYNRRIQEGDASFGIVMLDLNLLKETNDTYGHYVGDKLISTAAQIIADSFKRSLVFRIGGDEFLVILENRDLEDRENLFKKFEADCKKSYAEEENAKVPISIAMGFAEFDPKTDTKFDDVFNRADGEMYKNKRNMKIPTI
jgi:diguanylate cyclase (GGDEF)-like protein